MSWANVNNNASQDDNWSVQEKQQQSQWNTSMDDFRPQAGSTVFDQVISAINRERTRIFCSAQARDLQNFIEDALIPNSEDSKRKSRSPRSPISPYQCEEVFLIIDHPLTETSTQNTLALVQAVKSMAQITGPLFVFKSQVSTLERQILLAMDVKIADGSLDSLIKSLSLQPKKVLFWSSKCMLDDIFKYYYGVWDLNRVVAVSDRVEGKSEKFRKVQDLMTVWSSPQKLQDLHVQIAYFPLAVLHQVDQKYFK